MLPGRSYFRLALLAPPVIALFNPAAWVMLLVAGFGYLPLALWLWLRLARVRSYAGAIGLLLLSPLLFVILLALAWSLIMGTGAVSASDKAIPALVLMGLMGGYIYVAIVAVLLVVGRLAGLVGAMQEGARSAP